MRIPEKNIDYICAHCRHLLSTFKSNKPKFCSECGERFCIPPEVLHDSTGKFSIEVITEEDGTLSITTKDGHNSFRFYHSDKKTVEKIGMLLKRAANRSEVI